MRKLLFLLRLHQMNLNEFQRAPLYTTMDEEDGNSEWFILAFHT